jgi:hypothetical protein
MYLITEMMMGMQDTTYKENFSSKRGLLVPGMTSVLHLVCLCSSGIINT